jgi:hypothetical protein
MTAGPGDHIREAIAAFDAGNHAWGRFYLYTLHRYTGAVPDVAGVRTALQDAVLAVPHEGHDHQVREFRTAIAATLRAIEIFIADAPEPLRTGDLLQAPEALAEELDLLQADA